MRSGSARDRHAAAVDLRKLSIGEMRAYVASVGGAVSARTLRALRRDERRGAQALYSALTKRIARERRERLRIRRMLRVEHVLWRSGIRYVVGVDEVGIGPLAGPVVAAAVTFAPGTTLAGVDDSKRLDAETRAALARMIRQKAVGFGIGVATVQEIDRLNVYHAGLLAMRRAVETLPVTPQYVLVDARTIPGLLAPQQPLIKGDETCFSIAAASIIAKTHRDRLMTKWDSHYPEYGFCRHKGYATREHQAAIRRYGPCALHRRSYPFLEELSGRYSSEFYAIRKGLARAHSAEQLEVVEHRLRNMDAQLVKCERQKLKLLLARRRRGR